jgi:hypothetical protein
VDENALKLVALLVLPTYHIDAFDDAKVEVPEHGADPIACHIFKNPGNAHAGRIDRKGIEVNSRSHLDDLSVYFLLTIIFSEIHFNFFLPLEKVEPNPS